MKRSLIFSLCSLLLISLLTACGTSSTSSDSTEKVTATTGTNPNETDGNEDVSTDSSSSNEITYSFDEQEITETAQLEKSSEQNYSIHVLPGFELVAEEPGKDVLYLNEDSTIFMRIEMLDDSINIDELIDSTKNQLAVVSNVVTFDETSANVEIDEAIKLEANSDDQIATSYIYKGEIPWKITMYTSASADYRDAFLEMAKTITINEKN